VFVPLPLPDDKGRNLVLGRMGVQPPETKVADLMKVCLMTVDILMEEKDRVVICGSTDVMDYEKNTMAHVVQITPAIAKKLTTVFQVNFAEPPFATNYP
jgi:hypothetical protein